MMGRRPGQRVGPSRTRRESPLGEALERARCAKGLTIAELAAQSHVGVRTIKGILEGRGTSRHWSLHRLYGVLGNLNEAARRIEAGRARGRGRRKGCDAGDL